MSEIIKPTHIDVASHYYKDAVDFLHRFQLCWESERYNFQAVKSKRFKAFTDLRMALECTLKSIYSYKIHNSLSGEALIKRMRQYSHKIGILPLEISNLLSKELLDWLNQVSDLCDNNLTVDIRYRLDAFDFRSNDEEIYYQTIGDDTWLLKFFENTKELANYIGNELSNESRIISSSELHSLMIAEILAYSPYRSKQAKKNKN